MKAQAEEVDAEKEARGEHVKRDHIRVGAAAAGSKGATSCPSRARAGGRFSQGPTPADSTGS